MLSFKSQQSYTEICWFWSSLCSVARNLYCSDSKIGTYSTCIIFKGTLLWKWNMRTLPPIYKNFVKHKQDQYNNNNNDNAYFVLWLSILSLGLYPGLKRPLVWWAGTVSQSIMCIILIRPHLHSRSPPGLLFTVCQSERLKLSTVQLSDIILRSNAEHRSILF